MNITTFTSSKYFTTGGMSENGFLLNMTHQLNLFSISEISTISIIFLPSAV